MRLGSASVEKKNWHHNQNSRSLSSIALFLFLIIVVRCIQRKRFTWKNTRQTATQLPRSIGFGFGEENQISFDFRPSCLFILWLSTPQNKQMSFLATFVRLIYSSTNNISGQIERTSDFYLFTKPGGSVIPFTVQLYDMYRSKPFCLKLCAPFYSLSVLSSRKWYAI